MKKEKKSKKLSVMFRAENIELIALSAEKRHDLFKRWLEIYGNGSQSENTTLLDKFTNDRFPVMLDNDAKEKYENIDSTPGYFLILDHIGTSAYQMEKTPLPSWKLLEEINSRGKDVCVTSLDLSWTLFFGNEGQTGTFVQK